FERSPELVIAALGVLMAGGAYLPLDPAHPEERQAMLLADAGAALVLTPETWPDAPARVLPEVHPEGLAYVLYTSGSTGRPKGVMVQHRALARYLDWALVAYAAAAGQGAPVHSSLAFDLTVTGLWAPLLAGRAVTLLPEEHGIEALAATVHPEADFSLVKLTPAHLDLLAQQVSPESVAGWTRALVVGGEALRQESLAFWREHAPQTRIFNEYGPTETVVGCSVYEVPASGTGALPIGRPIAGARLYVLDRGFQPVPLGVAGELCIGGEGVTRGYRGDPARTAERFVPDPFVEPGARLYRSGDLARWRADGMLEYLGRTDHQLKVRGFRIEPGEIESALLEHPGARECVVVAREDAAGVRLVAYVAGEGLPGAGELRSFLSRRLPEYMLPSAFVALEALPLTPNGKVDRRALSASAVPERAGLVEGYAAPADAVEELLAAIWAELLGLERVGVHDDFFALGGHSLLATQVASRIRRTFGVELPLRRLFEAPTISRLARWVREARQEEAAPPIVPVPRDAPEDGLPLSFAQQRLWLLDQLEPGGTRYNIPALLRLVGSLDLPPFAAAVDEIVRRHEVLRTTFAAGVTGKGAPVQVVAPAVRRALPVADLGGLPEAARETEAVRLAEAELSRPFDLAAGPLLRVTLVRLSPGDHVMLANMHHIVSDGWSVGLLTRELETLYGSFLAGRPSPLPELPIQYADFAVWQRQWLEQGVLERQLAWWRERLAGAPALLELPTDRPRPAVQSGRGNSVPVRLPAGLGQALAALGRSQGATLFMTLLGLFQALLGRHTGSDDLVVGSPIAGRTRAEIEPLIGFFVNTLVLRIDLMGGLSGGPGVRQLVGRVAEVALEAYAHQDVPFERLVEELAPQRSLGHTPLFQVVFALQNVPMGGRMDLPGLEVRGLPMAARTAKFDLSLDLAEAGGEIFGHLEYSTDLFDAPTVARLGERFRTLLEAAAADPERPVRDLPLLPAPERQQVLIEWSDTAKPCPQTPRVHELVSAHARRQPQATAMANAQGRRLTYGELEAKSNRLAWHLRGLGVGPEARVAVCMERTLERAVAILGVVKAGGVYVTLDPTYPRERLAYLLEDAGAAVLLTEERFAPVLPETGARVLRVDADWPEIQGDEATAPASGVSPENLAYVVYTSGSTGRPKGVEIPHAGLMNLVRWHQDLYGVQPEDRGTQIASPSFDASIWELWPYLCGGASLYIPDEETRLSSPGMIRWWAAQGITLAYLMTPLAEGVLEEKVPEGLPLSVRALIIGGDRLHRGPDPEVGFRLMNHYGPAEYTVTSTVVEVPPRREGAEGKTLPSIGRAIDNTRIYILDREQRPVPAGVTGELYVAGIGLARGYAHRPDMTAEKFVPDPFTGPWGEPGERMYRTGDLVRWLPDGDIDFLGRIDHQVKIRGFRIELGEIESVLGRHPEVREAAVLLREDRPGDKRLAAYVVPAPGARLETEALRGFLRQELPEHMVPAALVLLDVLPLTPNGKVDRRALPVPERGPSEGGDEGFLDAVEELLAGIWTEVLGLERVGVQESFFELGGHSLLATQVVSRVRTLLGVELPLRALFESPTVSGLARVVRESREGPQAPPIVPVPRDVLGGDLPLSFAQQRLWFLDQLEPGSAAYNIPLAVRLTGDLPAGLPERIFAEVVRRHEPLRTTFASHDGRAVQVISPPRVELPVVDLSLVPALVSDSEALRLAREEARRPFDLARGPLLRLSLIRLDEREHVLLVTMHHIVSDGWSMSVLLREVAALYAGRSLPDLAVQYADFAVWQRSWLAGEVLEARLEYWRRQLGHLNGAPQVLELPLDRPRPAVQTFRGASRDLSLPLELSAAVHGLCRREGATPFMAFLAAWAVLLGRHAHQEDVLVGTPIAGRNRREIEDLIGFFVNTLVLRADLSGDPGFGELLRQIRRTALDGYAHQDVPFERLVEELVPERSLAHSPLFQVALALQNAAGGSPGLSVPGLALTPLVQSGGPAKFDLTLVLQESAGGFAGVLEYSADLFDDSTAARLLARFEALLGGALADPESALPDLPLLLPAERQQALLEWNDAWSGYPRESSLPELFADVARSVPEAPAIVADGEVWSYRRLDEASNRLARRLRSLGMEPETAVAVSMERSPELVAAILAILKAGGVYVPLDAEYPDERLAFMLADTGAEAVLVHARTQERLQGRARLIPVDGTGLDEGDGSPLAVKTPAECLAYVIYTSGSTGRPKGVAVPHRAIARLVRETDYIQLGRDDRVAFLSNISFDAATFDLWGALLNGAAVVPIPRDVALSPAAFAARLRRDGVTALFLTTALFNQVMREVPDAFATLRYLLFGGEASDPASVTRALELGAPERLLHVYGPTESTTFATWHRVREVARGTTTLPIGRPLANTTAYVLDRRHGAVPPGAAGELCIGGDGLARGYLNRPELTAERFIPHPWGVGERLYRTGDLARLLPDGAVDFLGRLDDQVKIRGFRIEPGEIEAVLAALPEVRACAVLARRDSPGETRLVAYVVYREGRVPPSEELRNRLRERLPDYMVPAAFVVLEALPLTPNGKVDRRALSASAAPERTVSAGGEALDPIEELLAGIWAEVLGLDRVGTGEDFFALGGHSLLATQVVSRVRSVLGAELPVRTLFESPTVAGLARAVQESGEGQAPPIVPVLRDGDLPLSFAQQRLWFLDQLEPGNPAYNIPLAVRLTGELPVDRLRGVFAEVVRRHESLRTTFASRDGRAVQVISPPRVELPVLDLSQVPESEALRLARDEARRPFDLQRGPLLRLALVRLSEKEHLLLLTMHHVVSDGWSMGVLLREIAALHSGRALPELAVQYADFAVWQRSWLEGEVLEAQLEYWRRQLGHLNGAPQVLELPLDRPRPAVQTFRGAARDISLPLDLSAAVHGLCRREGATPFMVLLAAWAVLLGRHAGQHDVLVGTPVAGRNRREIEDLIGFFVNTLVLRADLSEGLGFGGLLRQVRRTALDGYAHQDVPFERLVEELAPERDMSRSPLFQVMLVLQNAPGESLSVPGLTLTPLALEGGAAKFDLTLALQERGDRTFAGTLEHNADLFDGSTAARLCARFTALLAAAAADPDLPVSELPLLLPEERHQSLLEWNDTARPYVAGVTLHELIARQAESAPDAVAACFEDEALSYGELERRANRLAHRLVGLGVEPDGRVGVRMERSLEMIVALLGILKAGAAYVPLDPSYPQERLALLAASSGARVVLTAESWQETGERTDAVPARVLEGNLAYVIYTSGSTGTPKGVMVPHRGIVNRLLWMQEAYGLIPGDRVLQKTPFSFDVSVWEFFWPLLVGSRLVFARPEGHKDPFYLADVIAREEITTLHFVPSMLQAFLEAPGVSELRSVRQVMASGEALPPELVRRFYSRIPGTALHNLYGPTEASVDVSFWACEPDPAVVPIGRPIANLRLHVVDRGLRLQPAGVPGELLLGGVGLARGYLGRPDLTAASFVPDPFGSEAGGRLYRTGDLARVLPDGEVEYLGRIDFQVKIRGFRIELGEIEAALASHPGVRECVVLVREDVPGSRRLAAYLVGEDLPDADGLRAFLSRRLPDYMVPSVFVPLDALPLSPNGKVDRKALSALAAPEIVGDPTASNPVDPVEELLAGIWAEVLRLGRVGVHDDFFALGGHSLLATQVVSRIRAVLGVELAVRALFEAPTVAGLARLVRESGEGRQAPPIVPVPRHDLPLSFAQQRLWFLDQLEPGSAAYNIPLAVRLTGELPAGVLAGVFAEIVRRHEALRTTFTSREGRPVQVISPPRVDLPVVDLSQVSESEALRLAREEARRPFDLEKGPLLRLTLLRLSEREHVLLLTQHHIVSDGWSMGVLLREIAALHAGSALPELPVQYADFAVWQRRWLGGEVLEAQLAYWRRQLAGAPRVLELPLDRPRPAVQTFGGASRGVVLPPRLSTAVRELCGREGATPFMVLLTAWATVLGRHAGQEDVLLGTPIAGRNRREIEGLIGFFVNTLVLRTDLSATPGFAELVGRARRTALDGYTHQDVPFERLVEELIPERDLAHSPLFQAMLVFQNAPGGDLSVPGLTLAPLPIESGVEKFDLSLGLQEGPEGIGGSLSYNTGLFDGSTAARLLARFEVLLEMAVAEPGLPVFELPLLLPEERHQALLEWNDTSRPYASGLCLHELAAQQAERTPDAIAASFDDESLSYRELDCRANRLAHHLAGLGIEPDDRVGVRLERSLEMIVALLGILKAGAAYVPLDPTYPAERLALLIESSGIAVVLDRNLPGARLPDTPPAGRIGDGNLAYVIYTSGSTGTPKGVMVPHRGIVNRLLWMQEAYPLTSRDRVLQKTPFTFDVSLGELFG
ncbi:MAG TPA: non-ribosomal peptide synthase/polyketide synthase, partial [Thermoanaerobaculia bacterium]|nr:non-ribosomal peptide synthase/polyketide synthase [Thermoanaerobaculia bacterium]